MSKIFIFKHIALIAITLILASVIAGCVGTKAPQGELEFAAKAASGLIITHKGGEPLTLKDEKITVKREVDGKVIDGLNADRRTEDQACLERIVDNRRCAGDNNPEYAIGPNYRKYQSNSYVKPSLHFLF